MWPRPAHAGRLLLGGLQILDLEQIDRVALARQRHEGAAMRWIFLQHVKAQDLGVELLRALQIENAQQDVTDLLELDHRVLRVSASGRIW
jgi:hypothetical protein